ncbi:MAG: hypothetical protein LQ348_002178 [Seirophora lacunosa]|nr:MAG: hypothetical protein LQ348_002178 [Seirophora lacunosa]
MATGADVRDMLGLPGDAQSKVRPPKKAKQEVKGKRLGALEREIQGLHGDRPAPPLAINEVVKYKEKPKRIQRPRHWELTPFGNRARKDGLVLRHWRWRDDQNINAFPTTPADSNAASEEQDDRPKPASDYPYAKFNIRVDRPDYNEEQYNTKLKSPDWTKDETDYLMDLAYEFDLRWAVIADRYDYTPTPPEPVQDGDAMAITPRTKHRTMEDLKARYYQVAAVAMTLTNPLTSMSESEFAIHERMTKFDPVLETKRKQFAEGLLSRSQDEVQEEEMLLAELKRIVKNEEKFMQERQELYARLETAPSTANAAVNRSYEGLNQLLKTLMEAERNKRKRLLNVDGSSSLANGAPGANAGGQGDRGQRQPLGAADKRSSLPGAGQRHLSARDELKYGVTHHERLTAGVQFRHEKITKLSQAKSNAQTTKIAGALTELGIPSRIYMPTAKTTNEYERLIQSINILLDVRKFSEKVDAEIRVLQAQNEPKGLEDGDVEMTSPIQIDGTAEEQQSADQNVADAGADADADADADAEVEADGDEAVNKAAGSDQGNESDEENQGNDEGNGNDNGNNDDAGQPEGREGEEENNDLGEDSGNDGVE